MSDWKYAQKRGTERLAKLSFYAFTVEQDGKEIPFRITIHEFAAPEDRNMQFYAEADKQTNQSEAPFTPCGWGVSELVALEHCIRAIKQFPYQGSE